jgi:hypothetical protein
MTVYVNMDGKPVKPHGTGKRRNILSNSDPPQKPACNQIFARNFMRRIDTHRSTGLVSQPNLIQELGNGMSDLQRAHYHFFGLSR